MLASAAIKYIYFFCGLFFVSMSSQSIAEPFNVDYAYVKKTHNHVTLEAKIQYPLTLRVKEAIDNGVPIVFFQQVEVVERRPLIGTHWQWGKTQWTSTLNYELRYHALSKQYILQNMKTKVSLSFSSLKNALFELGEVKFSPLPFQHFEYPEKITVKLRSGLDLYRLPVPMQLGALVSDKWDLTSQWKAATWL